MTWKDRLLKVAALVLAISLTCVWLSLVFFPQNDDPLGFFLFLSTVSGAALALDKLFSSETMGRYRRGFTSELDAARYLEDERRMEIEANENRMADLEARLEFTERLLANQERDRLNSPPRDRSFDTGSRSSHRTPPQRTPRP